MAQQVVVFGGTGFIGEYVVRELEKRGQACVVIDAATSRETALNALANATHIMWLIPPVPGLLRGFARDISAAPHLEKFLYASTVLLYDSSDAPQKEDAPLRPCTDYERRKFEEEEIVRDMFLKRPEALIIARFANVYGDVKNRGVTGKIFSALRDGSTFLVNDGSQRRDYIHVADVARLATDLLLTGAARGIYNVSTGVAHSLRELIGKIERVAGKKVRVTWSDSIEEKHTIVADPAKLKKLLKRVAMRSLDEGLEETHKRYAL